MRKGFTLIELSIVLVIIGLIVGGVLVGNDLIKSAQLRAQISDWEKFNSSVMTFKGKYNCLPGDCTNPGQFFSVAGIPSGVLIVGDGNGYIGDSSQQAPAYTTSNEISGVFEHLNLAGMTGITGYNACCGLSSITPGKTIPALRVGDGKSVWMLTGACVTTTNCPSATPHVPTKNYIVTGYIDSNSNIGSANFSSGILLPTEAYYIDSKIDDGAPLTGNVLASRGGNAPPYYTWAFLDYDAYSNICITNSATNTYYTTSTNRTCSLMIGAPY